MERLSDGCGDPWAEDTRMSHSQGHSGHGMLGNVGTWLLTEKLSAKGWKKRLWGCRSHADGTADRISLGETKVHGGSSNKAAGGSPIQEYMVSCSHSWMFTWICPEPSLSRDLKARNMASSLTKQLMKLSKSMLPPSSE